MTDPNFIGTPIMDREDSCTLSKQAVGDLETACRLILRELQRADYRLSRLEAVIGLPPISSADDDQQAIH